MKIYVLKHGAPGDDPSLVAASPDPEKLHEHAQEYLERLGKPSSLISDMGPGDFISIGELAWLSIEPIDWIG